MKGRVVADCRLTPSERNCQLVISGPEKDVVMVAARHAVEEHGHKDSPELREEIRKMLKEE